MSNTNALASPEAPVQFTPARSAWNMRLMVFVLLVSAPFIWGAYSGARYIFNGGIETVGNLKKVDLKALGNFNFDQSNGGIEDVPAIYRKLDGQKVMLEGFMWSPVDASRLHDFQFVYNIQKCCFSGPPLVQERVFVRCPGNKSISYIPEYMKVTGTLHVDVRKVDGVITSVYTMELDRANKV